MLLQLTRTVWPLCYNRGFSTAVFERTYAILNHCQFNSVAVTFDFSSVLFYSILKSQDYGDVSAGAQEVRLTMS